MRRRVNKTDIRRAAKLKVGDRVRSRFMFANECHEEGTIVAIEEAPLTELLEQTGSVSLVDDENIGISPYGRFTIDFTRKDDGSTWRCGFRCGSLLRRYPGRQKREI